MPQVGRTTPLLEDQSKISPAPVLRTYTLSLNPGKRQLPPVNTMLAVKCGLIAEKYKLFHIQSQQSSKSSRFKRGAKYGLLRTQLLFNKNI